MWKRLYELVRDAGKYNTAVGGTLGQHVMPVKQLATWCEQHGFRGDATAVLNLIRRECKTQKQLQHEQMGLVDDKDITLQQLKRFHGRTTKPGFLGQLHGQGVSGAASTQIHSTGSEVEGDKASEEGSSRDGDTADDEPEAAKEKGTKKEKQKEVTLKSRSRRKPEQPAPNTLHEAATRFAQILLQKYGTLLRAWRLLLDARGTGMMEFNGM